MIYLSLTPTLHGSGDQHTTDAVRREMALKMTETSDGSQESGIINGCVGRTRLDVGVVDYCSPVS